MVPAARIYSAD